MGCQHGNKKERCAQCAWVAMKSPPSTRETRDQRMARKLVAKGLSVEETADVMELEVGQMSALLGSPSHVTSPYCKRPARGQSHSGRKEALAPTGFPTRMQAAPTKSIPQRPWQQALQGPQPTLLRAHVGQKKSAKEGVRLAPHVNYIEMRLHNEVTLHRRF